MPKFTYAKSMQDLIRRFSKMPGIGTKSAERLTFHILRSPYEEMKRLAQAIITVKSSIKFCTVCNNLSEGERCLICQDEKRDRTMLCVVEEPNDVSAIEAAGGYNGLYHVLLGRLSPLDGIGPDDLKIAELIERVKAGGIKEIIMAIGSDTEGETTFLYLAKTLRPYNISLSRIASGIPVGGDIKYADQATLAKALEGRRAV